LEDQAWRFSLFGDELEAITEFDPLTGRTSGNLDFVRIYANSHYVVPKPTVQQAINTIRLELEQRLAFLEANGKLLEIERLERRTMLDLEMLVATGICPGIENYSHHLTGLQLCLNTCLTTRFCLLMKATSVSANWVAWSAATTSARKLWPISASGCLRASTIAPSPSRNGMFCGPKAYLYQQPQGLGSWNKRVASLPSNSFARPA
jgi:hypothetical protein